MKIKQKTTEEYEQEHLDKALEAAKWRRCFLIWPRLMGSSWTWLEIVLKRTLYYKSIYIGGNDSGKWYPDIKGKWYPEINYGALTEDGIDCRKLDSDETCLSFTHGVTYYKAIK